MLCRMNESRVDEVADGIFRINTPIPPSVVPGGFSFNQYLIRDDEPLLFHTGSRKLFPSVSEAISRIIPLSSLRYIGSSHHEQDEDGALNEFLAAAPMAVPVCSLVGAMINADGMDRPPRALRDGEHLSIGQRQVTWYDAPHLPHGWETGYIYESTSQVLFCGDILTQPGPGDEPTIEADILGPAEAFRKAMDYFSHGSMAPSHLKRLASLEPKTLACMHGSAWLGDGRALLIELAGLLSK